MIIGFSTYALKNGVINALELTTLLLVEFYKKLCGFILTHMYSWSHQIRAAMTVDRMDAKAALEVTSAYQ